MLIGAAIRRLDGGMKPHLPGPVPEVLFALPYALVAAVVWHNWFGLTAAITVGLATLGITTWTQVKGHGRGLGLGEPMKPGAEPEDIEWPILWLEDKLPTYWYKALIMAVSGLIITVPCGILTLNPMLALSGLSKAPAYMLSYKAGANSEGGELLTGAVLWGALLIGL